MKFGAGGSKIWVSVSELHENDNNREGAPAAIIIAAGEVAPAGCSNNDILFNVFS